MKIKSPHPSLRATLSPLGRGEEILSRTAGYLPLPAKRGEGRGEGRVNFVCFKSVFIRVNPW